MGFRNFTRNATNSSDSICYSQQAVSKEETNLKTAIPILLTVIAVTNNLLVMFLVFCTKQLRKNINFYIVNMAVSDIITSLLICMRYIVSYLYEAHGILILNDIMCKVFHYFKAVAPTASLFTLLVISSDRYRAVSCPLNVTNIPRPCFVSLVLLTWIIPGTIYFHEVVNPEHIPGRDQCKNNPVFSGSTVTEIIALLFLLFLYLCLIAINIQILRKLCKSSGDLSELSEIEKRKRDKKFRNAVKMVLCSMALYLLCTSPAVTFHLTTHALPDFMCSTYVPILLSVFQTLFVLNSALGPVIYFIFLQDFREAFKSRFCHGICCVWRVRPATDQHNTLPCHQSRTSLHQDNPVFEPNDG